MLLRLGLLALLGLCGYALLDYDRRRPAAADDGPTNDFERRLLAVEGPALPSVEAFQSALTRLLDKARKSGAEHLDITASDLAQQVAGDEEGRSSERSCQVMRNAMSRGDMLLREPRSGVGPTLSVRYFL